MKTSTAQIGIRPSTGPVPTDGGRGGHDLLLGCGPLAVAATMLQYQQSSGDTGSDATFADFEGQSLGVGPVLSCAPEPRGGGALPVGARSRAALAVDPPREGEFARPAPNLLRPKP